MRHSLRRPRGCAANASASACAVARCAWLWSCKPRWRERLPELAIPALVVHGRRDPFFPVGNAEALARELLGARLLVLERAATAIPNAAASEDAAAMLAL